MYGLLVDMGYGLMELKKQFKPNLSKNINQISIYRGVGHFIFFAKIAIFGSKLGRVGLFLLF